MPASWKAWFLESQGPPEWGLVIAGPYRIAAGEVFLAGTINGVVFVAGIDDTGNTGIVFLPGPTAGETS